MPGTVGLQGRTLLLGQAVTLSWPTRQCVIDSSASSRIWLPYTA